MTDKEVPQSFMDKMRPYSDYMIGQVNKEIAYAHGYFTAGRLYYKVLPMGYWEVSDEPTGKIGNKMIFSDKMRLDEALECFLNQPDIFPNSFDRDIYLHYAFRNKGNNAINKAMYDTPDN